MVWAQTPGGVIAAGGELPWDVPEDFEHFRATVAGRPVIAGRATWESMPPRWRANRAARGDRSVVVTRDASWGTSPEAAGTEVAHSMAAAVALLGERDGHDGEPGTDQGVTDIWVMGGGQIYSLGMAFADVLLVTEIDVPEPTGALTLAPGIDADQWQEDTPSDLGAWRTSRTGTRWRVRRLRATRRDERVDA